METLHNRISLKEASELTGYHPDYLSQLIRKRKLKGEKIGRNWFTSREGVNAYLASQKFVSANTIASSHKSFPVYAAGFIILLCFAIGLVWVSVYESVSTASRVSDKDSAVLTAESESTAIRFED